MMISDTLIRFFDLDEFVLQLISYGGTDLCQGIHITKSNKSKESIVCYYWFFKYSFKFRNLFVMHVMIW